MCGDKENPIQYVGTELKVALTIECDGFSMDTDNWTAEVCCGRKHIDYSRTQNTVNVDGTWIMLIDSTLLGAGLYWLVTEYDVPDSDCPDGVRHVVKKQSLFNVEYVWQ